jgi:hypothetical protein
MAGHDQTVAGNGYGLVTKPRDLPKCLKTLMFSLPNPFGNEKTKPLKLHMFSLPAIIERVRTYRSVSLNLFTPVTATAITATTERGRTMCFEKLARYVVNVPPGLSISEAVARHRENTGHGGACILRFARPDAQRPSGAVVAS